MSQSLLDDESSPPEDDKEAQIHQLEKKVDTLNCEMALLHQHMDSGFALIRSDIAARFAESDLRISERQAEADRKYLERFAEAERRHTNDMQALANQLQAQIVESEKRQEGRLLELARRLDAFSRWMVGLTVGIVVLTANLASRFF